MQVFRQFTPHSFSTATSSLHPHLVHRLIFGDEDLRVDFSLRTLAVRSSWFLHPVAGIHRGNQTSRCVANSRFLENVRVFAASMKAASLVRKCIKIITISRQQCILSQADQYYFPGVQYWIWWCRGIEEQLDASSTSEQATSLCCG